MPRDVEANIWDHKLEQVTDSIMNLLDLMPGLNRPELRKRIMDILSEYI